MGKAAPTGDGSGATMRLARALDAVRVRLMQVPVRLEPHPEGHHGHLPRPDRRDLSGARARLPHPLPRQPILAAQPPPARRPRTRRRSTWSMRATAPCATASGSWSPTTAKRAASPIPRWQGRRHRRLGAVRSGSRSRGARRPVSRRAGAARQADRGLRTVLRARRRVRLGKSRETWNGSTANSERQPTPRLRSSPDALGFSRMRATVKGPTTCEPRWS